MQITSNIDRFAHEYIGHDSQFGDVFTHWVETGKLDLWSREELAEAMSIVASKASILIYAGNGSLEAFSFALAAEVDRRIWTGSL